MTASLEDIKSLDIEQWLTLNTAASPTKLTPGQTPDMQNVWTDEKPGSIITAPGFIKVGQVPSGNPCSFCINYFKTSSGTQTFVVSDNGTVWTTVDFQNFTPIITGLSSAFQLRGAVIRDKLWLTNGSDAVQVFDGITVTPLIGTPASLIIQDVTFLSATTLYTPSDIVITYTDGGTAGAEVVSVTGTAINIQIQSGVSTTQQILNAVRASSDASAIVSVTGIDGASPQTAPVSEMALSGGIPAAPRARYIDYHDERVWLYHVSSNRSACYFSALTDAAANIINPDDLSAWDTVDNFLQISEGDADFGTGLLIYRGYLHFFKQYSIWRLVGYDEYSYSRVKTRSSTGTRFNESIQILDSLVHLIGIDGIYVFDGEESDRISDLIDPSTASQTAFGFNQLQQPNQNSQFWEVSSTSDWNAGTVPSNVSINNELDLVAADDSQSDFQAAPVQTNIDLLENPGNIQLSYTGFTGFASEPNIALNAASALVPTTGLSIIGAPSFITDGDNSNTVGFSVANVGSFTGYYEITLPRSYPVSFITFKNWRNAVGFKIQVFIDGTIVVLDSVNDPIGFAAIVGNFLVDGKVPPVTRDIVLGITATVGTVIHIVVTGASSIGNTFTVTDLIVQATNFNSTGQFVSKTLNLGAAPSSLGIFNVSEVLNGETTSYFTQSSNDGSSWDAGVPVSNGDAIGSTPRQYLRWGVNITSDGLNTPAIDAVFLPTLYISAIHNTAGNIFAWGPFESDRSLAAQTINYFYRTSFFSAGVFSAPWNLIVPGGVISDPVANQYVQFKIEISGGTATNLPSVDSVTINWVVGVAGQAQTLQNVASAYWRNRYWLSAAGASATANNTILIRGKKTFESPWMLKDWNILAFTRYQDSFYGCSSLDGSIYQLDTGYSKAGASMNSYFQTGDFVFNGFAVNLKEIDIEVERTGNYSIAIGVSVNNGNTWTELFVDLSPSTFDDNYMKRLNFNITTTRFRIRFRTVGVDIPFQVHRAIVYYTVSPARGSIRGDYLTS